MILTGLILMTVNVNNIVTFADIQTYKMEEHCDTMIHMIMDSVYQIRFELDDIYIQSRQTARPASCQTEIEPWYTWPNLIFYFENLDLDCELGYLQFFQSTTNSTRVKGLEIDICGDVKPKGIYFLEGERYLQVRYVAKKNQYIEGAFSVIITSYAKEPCPDHSFKCDNSRCIDREIRCDGYDSCGDDSGCRFDLSSAAIAAIIICSLVGLFVLISIVVCVVCCVNKNRKSQERSRNQTQPGVVYTVTANGNGYLGPPSYSSSGQSGQSRSNVVNSLNYGGDRSASSHAQPTNITGGQSPAYPPNFTMPSYEQDIFQNPPPYEEMQANVQNNDDSTDHVRENTDNDVLENLNSTDDVGTEERDLTEEEGAEENTVRSELPYDQVSEGTIGDIQHDTESEDSDQNDDETYETVSHTDGVPDKDNNECECIDDVTGLATRAKTVDSESEIEVVNSYTNFLYSDDYTEKNEDNLEKHVDAKDACRENDNKDETVATEESNYESMCDSSDEQDVKIQ